MAEKREHKVRKTKKIERERQKKKKNQAVG